MMVLKMQKLVLLMKFMCFSLVEFLMLKVKSGDNVGKFPKVDLVLRF